MKKRKKYTDQFKRDAVSRLANEKLADVAASLKVHPTSLTGWRRQLSATHVDADTRMVDAIAYLKDVERIIHGGGKSKLGHVELLTLLALRTLTGGGR